MHQELPTCEHSAGLPGARNEEVELGRRQLDLTTRDRHLPAGGVDSDVPDREPLTPAGRAVDPPQDRTNASKQLAGAERLDDVVVSAKLQADHAVGRRIARRQPPDLVVARWRRW